MNHRIRRGLLTAAIFLAAALSWAQIPTSRADIMKVATQRLDTIAKKLKLSPDQIDKIKPLLIQQTEKTEAARTNFATSDHSAAAKQEALDAIQQSRASTKGQVKDILTPDQSKQWDGMAQDWKDDVNLQGLGNVLKK